jgi:hypothetical protein
MTMQRTTILALGVAGALILGLGGTASQAEQDTQARLAAPVTGATAQPALATGGMASDAALPMAKGNGKGKGPGDGTGNGGDGPRDGSGYGAPNGNSGATGNGSGNCDGTGPKGNRQGGKGRRGGRR